METEKDSKANMATTKVHLIHSSPKMHPPHRLSPAEREAVAVVLEDCVDQLAVLGGIIPNYAEKPSAVDAVSIHYKHTTPMGHL